MIENTKDILYLHLLTLTEVLNGVFDLLSGWITEDEHLKVLVVLGSFIVISSILFVLATRWLLILLPKLVRNHKSVQPVFFVTSRVREHPFTFAIMYFMLIPSFAGFYASLPENSLYSSTRKLDDHFYQDSYKYRGIFDDLARERYVASDQFIDSRKYYIKAQEIEEFGEKFFAITYHGRILRNCGSHCNEFTMTMYVNKIARYALPTSDPDHKVVVPAYLTKTKCIKSCPSIERLFAGLSGDQRKLEGLPINEDVRYTDLVMSKDQFNIYQDMNNAFSGNALGNYGRLSRALYFSTTVITTLGFGDVIPISEVARNAIMLQAILGLFLVGLFFNALSSRASRRRPSNNTTESLEPMFSQTVNGINIRLSKIDENIQQLSKRQFPADWSLSPGVSFGPTRTYRTAPVRIHTIQELSKETQQAIQTVLVKALNDYDFVMDLDLPAESNAFWKSFWVRTKKIATHKEVEERFNKIERVIGSKHFDERQAKTSKITADSISVVMHTLEEVRDVSIQLGNILIVKNTMLGVGQKTASVSIKKLTASEMCSIESNQSILNDF